MIDDTILLQTLFEQHVATFVIDKLNHYKLKKL